MKSVITKVLLYLIISSCFLSCATIISGTTQRVRFSSNPDGATLFVNGQNTGKTTPCEVKVDRRLIASEYNENNIQNYFFVKEGYESALVQGAAQSNALVWINLVPTFTLTPIVGLTCFLIDAKSGASKKYDDNINVNLKLIEKTKPAEPVKIASKAKNVRLDLKGDSLYITYDLVGDFPVENLYVEIVNKAKNELLPAKSFYGAIGGQYPGRDKMIVWDIKKDHSNLEGVELKVNIKTQ